MNDYVSKSAYFMPGYCRVCVLHRFWQSLGSFRERLKITQRGIVENLIFRDIATSLYPSHFSYCIDYMLSIRFSAFTHNATASFRT